MTDENVVAAAVNLSSLDVNAIDELLGNKEQVKSVLSQMSQSALDLISVSAAPAAQDGVRLITAKNGQFFRDLPRSRELAFDETPFVAKEALLLARHAERMSLVEIVTRFNLSDAKEQYAHILAPGAGKDISALDISNRIRALLARDALTAQERIQVYEFARSRYAETVNREFDSEKETVRRMLQRGFGHAERPAYAQEQETWRQRLDSLATPGQLEDERTIDNIRLGIKEILRYESRKRERLVAGTVREQVAEIQATMRAGFAQLTTRIERLEQGQTDLRQGQERLEQGQTDLRQNQERLEQGQTDLRQGQERLEQGQSDLRQNQERLEQGQSDLRQNQESLQATVHAGFAQLTARTERLEQGQAENKADLSIIKEVLQEQRSQYLERRVWNYCIRHGFSRLCKEAVPGLTLSRPQRLWHDRWAGEEAADEDLWHNALQKLGMTEAPDDDIALLETSDLLIQYRYARDEAEGAFLLVAEITANADRDGSRGGKVSKLTAMLRRQGFKVVPCLFTGSQGQVSNASRANGTLHFHYQASAWHLHADLNAGRLLRRHLS